VLKQLSVADFGSRAMLIEPSFTLEAKLTTFAASEVLQAHRICKSSEQSWNCYCTS
jgi:hypothetical protein